MPPSIILRHVAKGTDEQAHEKFIISKLIYRIFVVSKENPAARKIPQREKNLFYRKNIEFNLPQVNIDWENIARLIMYL